MVRSGEITSFDVMHFAAHVLVDSERPERSAIVLSQRNLPDPIQSVLKGNPATDGCIRVRDILHWKLNAELVVISGCDSGLGKHVSGEGVIGFAHAFFQAGARNLLASLWPVEDRSTALLMEAFYRDWLGLDSRHPELLTDSGVRPSMRSKLSKREALRRAKLWLRSYRDAEGNYPFEHPYFWAGFVLLGSD